jgi:hypothetical protein
MDLGWQQDWPCGNVLKRLITYMARKVESLGIRTSIWMLVGTSIAATIALWHSGKSSPPKLSDPKTIVGARIQTEVPTRSPQAMANGSLSTKPPGELPQSVLLDLSDPDVNVRRSALSVLRVVAPPQYDLVPILTACLNDSDAVVRAGAVEQLSAMRFKAAAAVPKLKELLSDDPDEVVQSRAKDALYNIRGYDFGFKDFLID